MSGDKFQPRSGQDVLELVLKQPFGWIVSGAGSTFRASALPFRPKLDSDARLVGLLGHFARSNPQVEALRAHPRAQILILGPNGYVSPSWMADRTQAPTWNYASVQFLTNVVFADEGPALEAILRDLIGAMEKGRANAWSVEEMGARYGLLAQRIIGFEAEIVEVRAKFKLGQDERRDVFADIMAGLEAQGATDLLALMAEFNR